MKHEKEIRTFLDLLKCSVTDRQPMLPPKDIDWHFLYQIALNQRITSTLYFGMSKFPKEVLDQIPEWESYILSYKKALVADANRAFEIENIKAELQKANIDFIFLKGSVTKYLYPDPAMRQMTDIDVLFRRSDFSVIEEIFKNQGYFLCKKDPDEISFFKPVNKIKIEMQQTLIDRGYVSWYNYLKNIWDHCILKDEASFSHEYVMAKEFFYLYHIIHMAKHFLKGGIGIKQCIDIYMLQKAYPLMDWEFIERELEHLNLKLFHENLTLLIKMWFYDKKFSSEEQFIIDLLLEYILKNGAYGRKIQEEINQAVRSQKKKPSMLAKIFPDYHTMNSYYGGSLSKHPFLLPLYWIRLNTKRLFKSRKEYQLLRHSLSEVTDSHMKQTWELMKRCGFEK